MATLRQIGNERRKFLRNLKPLFRKADASLEAIERELNRLTKNKRSYPEQTDLDRLLKLCDQHLKEFQKPLETLAKGFIA